MTQKVNIFVDDERDCPEGFLCARTFEEAKELLLANKGNISVVTLDNCLGGSIGEFGTDLFPFMKENGIFPDKLNCHTGLHPEEMARFAKGYFPETTKITANSLGFFIRVRMHRP